MRIAIILSGQARYIENGYSSTSHKLWARNHEVEFFGHYWNTDARALTSSWSDIDNLNIGSDVTDKVLEQYPGITVSSGTPLFFNVSTLDFAGVPLTSLNLDKLTQKEIDLSNTVSMMNSISKALALANLRHKEIPFDLFVLSRWDLFIRSMCAPEFIDCQTLSTLSQFTHFGDNIILGGPTQISSLDGFARIKEIYEIINQIDRYTYNGFMFVGENIKYISAKLHNPALEPIKISGDISLMRSESFTPTKKRSSKNFVKKLYLVIRKLVSLLR